MPSEKARTKKQLLDEVEELRAQVRELKKLQTEFQTVEQDLRCSEMQYEKLFENAQHGIVILDGNTGRIKNVNPHLLELLGYAGDEIIGQKLTDVEAFMDMEQSRTALAELKGKGHKRYADVPLQTKSGTIMDVEIESTLCDINNDRVIHYHIYDHTERKRAESEIRLMATHDTMTGLPNRTLFLDRAHLAIMHGARNSKRVAIVSLDLDKFSSVNETMGNDIGDRVLRAVVARFLGLLRKSDTVARVGGDEFAMVLPDVADVNSLEKIASKLVNAFRQHFIVSGRQIIVTISAGLAVYPDDGRNVGELVNCADRLMYKVRAEGCNNFKLSDSGTARLPL